MSHTIICLSPLNRAEISGKIPVPSDYKEKLADYNKSESEISEILVILQEI
jgi:hypothetical protein